MNHVRLVCAGNIPVLRTWRLFLADLVSAAVDEPSFSWFDRTCPLSLAEAEEHPERHVPGPRSVEVDRVVSRANDDVQET